RPGRSRRRPRLDAGLYLQSLCHILVVLEAPITSFHVRFDFHRVFLSLRLIAAMAAAYLYRRKRKVKLLVLLKKIFHPPERFSLSFTPVEVNGGHPWSRGYGDAVQRQP